MLNLQSIGVLDITEEFIERTSTTEFIEDPDFILEFSNSVNRNISQVIEKIKKLHNDQNIWNLISDEGGSIKAIQVWVHYILHHGLLLTATYREKERALLAAQIYFILLIQPGSDGSQFYHSVIYEKSLATFKMIARQNMKSKEKKSKSQEQDDQEKETVLTTDQQVSLLNTFNGVLRDFCRLLSTYSLKSRANEIKQTVEALILLLKSFTTTSKSVETVAEPTESDLELMSMPNQLALQALQSIVSLKHGKIDELSTLVFRLLMTTITMRHSTGCGSNLPRPAIRQAEAAMNLVAAVYAEHGASVERSARVLMQNIIAQCPDRMEYRNHVSNFVSTFVAAMPILWYADFVSWLKRFSNHARTGYRLGALGVINQLLVKPERSFTDSDGLSEEAQTSLTHKFVLEAVVVAVSDAASSVRAKGLSILADVMGQSSVSSVVFCELLQKSFTCSSPPKDGGTRLRSLVTPLPGVTPLILNSVPAPSLCLFEPTNSNLLSLLLKCSSETKFAVRKSAILALEAAICNGLIAATKESLAILSERCHDPLLSVRKCAIQAITKVLAVYPDNMNVRVTWISCLLPSISDAESSMQEKASQLIEEKILAKLLEDEDLPWNLLWYLTTEQGNQNRLYLQKVAKEWNHQKKLKKNILEKVVASLQIDKRRVQAWMLLSIFTLFAGDEATASAVIHHWMMERQVSHPMNMQIDMTSTAGQVAKFMTNDDKQIVIESLKSRVENGRCPIQLIGYAFEAIYKLMHSDHDDNIESKAEMGVWCNALLSSRDAWFSDVVIKPSQAGYDVDLLINHLYVVGEASQRCSGELPKRLLLSIQALLTNPSADSVHQSLSQPLSQLGDAGIPPSVRAHAIFNLGRICFHDESLAKKFVPALSRELATCEHEEVRNNALVILADLCILQTQLVDPFLREMANCLGDKSVTIRKHAIVLLSSLLQKEYVKWKDTLLFKFLFVSCDACEEVRSLARYFLLKQLLCGSLAAGNLFYRNFVACLFYYNSYDGHNMHKFTQGNLDAGAREKKLFDLSENFRKRQEIYEFILQNMEDQHRINLTGKLCTDVLEAFVEGTIPLNKKTQNLLTDTLSVLCCKDIRLRCLRAREDADLEDMELNNPNDQLRVMQNAAKHKVILQTVKMNLVENIIPIIIALKNMLFDAKSPLVKNVMLYLKEVMKEYRKEVQIILSADKQLASEIEFDLKRFDAEEEQVATLQEIPANALPAPRTPAKAAAVRVFTTPATLKRKKRPMNVEAILHSARKVLESPRPEFRQSFESSPTLDEPTPSMTPVKTRVADLRAASTPQSCADVNVTFARDISAIITSEPLNPRVVLLSHPEKTPPPATWNVTSPSHPNARRSTRKT